MKTFSNSRLSCYENCPMQFKFKYIDEIPPPHPFESIEQYLGLRIHEVLENLYQETNLCKVPTLEEMLSSYEDCWSENWGPQVRIIKKGLSSAEYKKTGRSSLIQYYRRYHPFAESKTLGTEYPIAFKLESYEIVGFIDRLALRPDGTYEIHDYKTSSRLPSKNLLQQDRQLALYQMGIEQLFHEVRETDLVWHYLVFDKEIRIRKCPEELEETKKSTLELISTILKEERFAPRESILCDWCEYAPICPAKQHQYKTKSLPIKDFDQEEGVFLVYRYQTLLKRMQKEEEKMLAIQEELKSLQKELEDYASRTSCQVLQGREGRLAISQRKCIRFPGLNQSNNEELRQWLMEQGVWEALSSLDLQKIRQYLLNENNPPEIRNKLLEYAQTYETSEFDFQ